MTGRLLSSLIKVFMMVFLSLELDYDTVVRCANQAGIQCLPSRPVAVEPEAVTTVKIGLVGTLLFEGHILKYMIHKEGNDVWRKLLLGQ
jgi:hypothetical protein